MSPSPQFRYTEQLAALIRDSRASPLEAVLRARLTGDRSPVHGIISPALSRDEPDANLLLYYTYDALKEEPAAREQLRRAIAELTGDALTGAAPDLDYVDALGRLTGYTQVRESGPVAGRLRHHLLSLLMNTLPFGPEKIMTLYGKELARAHRILDIFLAVTPPLWAEVGGYVLERFDAIFLQARKDLLDGRFHGEHFQLFLLLFRAVLKLRPEFAGECAFPAMCRVVEEIPASVGRESIRMQRAWFALCWEFSVPLENHHAWQARFLDGLKRQSVVNDLQRTAFWEIQRESLEEFGLDGELEEFLPDKSESGSNAWEKNIESLHRTQSANDPTYTETRLKAAAN